MQKAEKMDELTSMTDQCGKIQWHHQQLFQPYIQLARWGGWCKVGRIGEIILLTQRRKPSVFGYGVLHRWKKRGQGSLKLINVRGVRWEDDEERRDLSPHAKVSRGHSTGLAASVVVWTCYRGPGLATVLHRGRPGPEYGTRV